VKIRPAALLAVAAAAVIGTGITIAVVRSGDEPFRNSPAASDTLDRIDPAIPGQTDVTRPGADSAALLPPAATPQAAVAGLLDALVAGEPERSFSLLDAADRATLGPLPTWQSRASSLPRYLGYAVSGVDGTTVRTDVTIEPRLDEVVGYVPGRATIAWSTVAEDGGYRVSLTDSTTEPVLPADADAAVAAETWVAARQRCQADGGYSGNLLGQPTLAERLCRSSGTFRARAATSIERFGDPSILLNAFGADAATFVRVVPVDGPTPLQVALAPLGDAWEVIGVMQT
jgi:hypothetical protein